jgi:hypothetical protein
VHNTRTEVNIYLATTTKDFSVQEGTFKDQVLCLALVAAYDAGSRFGETGVSFASHHTAKTLDRTSKIEIFFLREQSANRTRGAM